VYGCVAEETLSSVREPHAAPVTDEYRRSKAPFERLDSATSCRLRQVKGFSGTAKTAVIRH